jgi:hypothetical protein
MHTRVQADQDDVGEAQTENTHANPGEPRNPPGGLLIEDCDRIVVRLTGFER